MFFRGEGGTALDKEIIDLLWTRSEWALDEVDKAYGKRLRGLARRLLCSEQDAEECVNDALLEIWESIPPKKPESLLSYACMLVRRGAIDRIRYSTALRRGGSGYDVALEELDGCIAGNGGLDPSQGELTEAINDFLARLSAKDRRIFLRRYYGLEELDAIAAACAMSKNAVNIRLSRMRNKLKACLIERGIWI